jgi:hypothetical protein
MSRLSCTLIHRDKSSVLKKAHHLPLNHRVEQNGGVIAPCNQKISHLREFSPLDGHLAVIFTGKNFGEIRIPACAREIGTENRDENRDRYYIDKTILNL